MRGRHFRLLWYVIVVFLLAGACAKKEVVKKNEPPVVESWKSGGLSSEKKETRPAPSPQLPPAYDLKPKPAPESIPRSEEPLEETAGMPGPETAGEEPQVNVLQPGSRGTAARSSGGRYSTSVIDRIIGGFDWGSFAFRYYSSVRIEDPPTLVVLKLSKKASERELRGSLSTGAGGERMDTGPLRLSNRIQATLASADFEITSLSPETQLISSTDTFEWQWQITPRHHGTGTLHLSVNALLDEGPYSLRTLDKTVRISVSTTTRAGSAIKGNWDYLKWAWTAIFVPVFGYFWNKGRKSAA